MPIWQVVLLVWLGLVLVLGLGSLVAERRGWIKARPYAVRSGVSTASIGPTVRRLTGQRRITSLSGG